MLGNLRIVEMYCVLLSHSLNMVWIGGFELVWIFYNLILLLHDHMVFVSKVDHEELS